MVWRLPPIIPLRAAESTIATDISDKSSVATHSEQHSSRVMVLVNQLAGTRIFGSYTER